MKYNLRTHNGLEIDLIIENQSRLVPFEIKLSKSPNPAMAKPIHHFKRQFSKLNIGEGMLISLVGEKFRISEEVICLGFSDYLNHLKKFI